MKKIPGDIIILHMCTKYHNHMMYGSWDTEWDRQKCLSFWTIFCPFSPLTTWKTKILRLKKTSRDIIIWHSCTINDNHMVYGSWDMERSRQTLWLFWALFCPFTPLWTQKIKILEKWTIHLKILSFYKCVPWMTVTWCMVPEIWNATDRISCLFGPGFVLLPPNNPKN